MPAHGDALGHLGHHADLGVVAPAPGRRNTRVSLPTSTGSVTCMFGEDHDIVQRDQLEVCHESKLRLILEYVNYWANELYWRS